MSNTGFGVRDSGLGKDPGPSRRSDSAARRAMRMGLAILAISVAQACAPRSSPKPASFFPDTNEVPGWSKTGETRTFEASRLWEYIDGDADKYIQAGVQKTLTADYRYREKIEAVADVYVMARGEGARKVFDSESSVGSKPIQIGPSADGRLWRASLTFHKGPYYVRLVAYEEAPEVADALVALGRAIESKLGAGEL